MAQRFLNLAAFLFFVALVIQEQTSDGAAPAPRGADAVAANLVNTVGAGCHTLERVNDKKADRDAWTATVARMKGLGANLTDEQIPVVVDFLTRTASPLTVAPGSGGRGGRGGGRGPATPFSAGGLPS